MKKQIIGLASALLILTGCGGTETTTENMISKKKEITIPKVNAGINSSLKVSNLPTELNLGEELDLNSIVLKDDEGNNIKNNVKIQSNINYSVPGTYTVIFTVMDDNGNTLKNYTYNVIVNKDLKPTLTLTGGSINLYLGENYIEPGYSAIDNEDGKLEVETSSNLDLSNIGSYTISYKVTDSFGHTVEKTRTVTVSKNEEPILSLKGGTLSMSRGTTFQEPGYIASDKEDGDISSCVKITSNLDTSTLGTYTITYSVTDSFGQSVKKTRTVTVNENEKPVLSLKGDTSLILRFRSAFKETGYTAFDKEDGDLYSSVKITSNIDAFDLGTFTVTYSVTDSIGQTVEKTRTVTIDKFTDIEYYDILEESSNDINYQYKLADYISPSKNDNFSLIQNFVDYNKKENQIKAIVTSGNIKMEKSAYTSQGIVYSENDNGLLVSVYKNNDLEDDNNTLLAEFQLDEFSTLKSNLSESNCSLRNHYNRIKFLDEEYSDVINVTCTFPEYTQMFYFQKDKGLIVQHKVTKESEDPIPYSLVETVSPKLDAIKGSRNLSSVKKTHADILFEAPYNLSGKGVNVGVIDAGNVLASHVEFKNVTNLVDADIDDHVTHIAGTICASGVNEEARGFAPNSNFFALDWENNTYDWGLVKLANKGVYISNHSYGYGDHSDYYSKYYGLMDGTVHDNHNIIPIKAAGNAGWRRFTDLEEYHTDHTMLTDASLSKNVIVVGALNQDNTLARFSSIGPANFGRIKPDVVAKGYKIISVGIDSDTSYEEMSGTSMASPAVTGVVVLMQEEYNKIHHELMTGDFVKAVLVQTAEDLGRAGPDIEFGYGLVNALEAIKLIDTMKDANPLVIKNELLLGTGHTYTFNVDEETTFKSTLCWIDDVGVDLVADLEFTIKDEDGKVYYSYTIDPEDPKKLASTDKDNHVDTVEQIEAVLVPGTYTVTIQTSTNKNLENIEYTLASTISLSEVETFDVSLSSPLPLHNREFAYGFLKASGLLENYLELSK